MKTLVISIFTFFALVNVPAQANYFTEAYNFNKFMDRVKEPGGKQLVYADIEGNAFFAPLFSMASIQNATQSILTRYNMYTDTVELRQGTDIFELPKNEKYGRVVFESPYAALIYMPEDGMPGYFFELAAGEYSLLKKEKTEFRPGAKAVNSFTREVPASFVQLKPAYYLKTKAGFFPLSKNLKNLTDIVPEKKTEIENFIRTNKLRMNNEQDFIRIVKFLNTK